MLTLSLSVGRNKSRHHLLLIMSGLYCIIFYYFRSAANPPYELASVCIQWRTYDFIRNKIA